MVVQKTQNYQTDLAVQRGLLVGFDYKNLNFATYLFNFGWTDPTVVLAAGATY